LLEPLLERGQRFVIRSTGKRTATLAGQRGRGGSPGLANPLVDRTNLPDALENRQNSPGEP